MTRSRDVATQGGLVLISSTTVGSAVTSVTVNNAFSTTYDNYLILLNGIDTNNVNQFMTLKFNNSSGSTYNYFVSYGIFAGSLYASTAASSSAGIYCALSGTNNDTSNSMTIHNPFAGSYTTVSGTGATENYGLFFGGNDKNAVSQTGFIITTTAGTMTGGTIKVYGYKK